MGKSWKIVDLLQLVRKCPEVENCGKIKKKST